MFVRNPLPGCGKNGKLNRLGFRFFSRVDEYFDRLSDSLLPDAIDRLIIYRLIPDLLL